MRAARFNDTDGFFTAIIGNPGRIYTPIVKIESPTSGPHIIRRQIANGDIDMFSSPLMNGDKPYPLKKAVNHMLRIGREQGITKSAKKMLMEAKCEANTGTPCTHKEVRT